MEVIDDAALRFSTTSEIASKVLGRLDKCELMGKNGDSCDVVTYWGFEEASYLAKFLGRDVPSPMIRDYDWPGVFKPFDHQITTSSFLSLQERAFCFNEAGTGKTSSVVWAADYLMKLGLVKRVLVVCPLSIMYAAWQADIFRTAMHRSVGVAYGSGNKRIKVIESTCEFVIINYDGVNIVQEELKAAQFDLIVIDEGNAYKTVSTKRWKAMLRLLTPSTRLWILTGTPAAQSPVDAYGLAKLISPWLVPKTATAWKDKVMQQITRFKWVPKKDSKKDVFAALQPAIRFTKSECLDLPEVLYLTRDVPLTTQVAIYYKKLKSQMLIQAAGENISAINAAASLTKLLQISGGAVYTDNHNVVEFDVSPRLHALKETLDETSNKVIIFVPYLHTIDIICEYLTKNGYTNAVIKGDVSARGRSDIIMQFQEQTDPRVLVIQPQSAAHGVTLTAADTIVFWSPVMSVETYLQCIARIDRVGQKNAMTVVHLQGSEVERRMYVMLQGKVDSHQKLVDLYKLEFKLELGI